MRLARRTAVAMLIALLGGMVFPAMTAGATGSTCWTYRDSERSFSRLLNRARVNHDRGKLDLDKQLSKVARKHSWEMRKRSRLYHTSSDKLGHRVTRWRVLGENVGVGSTVKSLHRAFMASPAHRANMLYSGFRHVGVGVQKRNGNIWVTLVFETKKDPGTRLEMPPC